MFVDSAVRKDVKAFTEESNKIITSRIDGIVAEMRKIIGSKLFSEEVVNELSKKTLGSYIKKASVDAKNHDYKAGRIDGGNSFRMSIGQDQKATDVSAKAQTKAQKRVKGIAKATDKLTKEETVDEEEVNEAAPPRETPETSTVHIDTAIGRAKDKHPELHKKLTSMKEKGAQWVVSHPRDGMKFYGGKKK